MHRILIHAPCNDTPSAHLSERRAASLLEGRSIARGRGRACLVLIVFAVRCPDVLCCCFVELNISNCLIIKYYEVVSKITIQNDLN